MTEFNIQWLKGALYGALTYVTALLFTAVWYYFDHSDSPINGATTEEKIGLGVGSFYNGQFVVGGQDFLGGFGSSGHGFLVTPMYQVIPVLVILLIAGTFVYTEINTRDRLEAVLSGASLAPGYVALSLVVVLAFRSLAGPDFLPIGMTIVSGIVYPVVLGGLAGVAAKELKGYVGEEEDEEDEEAPSTRAIEENL